MVHDKFQLAVSVELILVIICSLLIMIKSYLNIFYVSHRQKLYSPINAYVVLLFYFFFQFRLKERTTFKKFISEM